MALLEIDDERDTGADFEQKYPLARPIVFSWAKVLKRAWKFKQEEFQKDADDCWRFFAGTRKDMWDHEYAGSGNGYWNAGAGPIPCPGFGACPLPVAKGVQLFGHTVYAEDPTTNVTPVEPPEYTPEEMGIDPSDPAQVLQYQMLLMRQQRRTANLGGAAKAMEHLLNAYQRELDKKTHSRLVIDDSFVSGLGVGCTELFYPAGSDHPMPGTFFVSSKHFLQDRDAENDDEVQWQARLCCHPIHQIKELYPWLSVKELRKFANLESLASQGFRTDDIDDKWLREQGQTKDLLIYWKVWSKMGMGDRFRDDVRAKYDKTGKSLKLDRFGEYCYLLIAPSVPYPLNVPPKLWAKGASGGKGADELEEAVQWPIPFYEDDTWPFTKLQYWKLPGKLWPKSHFYKGLSHMKALAWIDSFMLDHLRASCGTIIGVIEEALTEDGKEAVKSGRDNVIVMLQKMAGKNLRGIKDVIDFIQAPPLSGDLHKLRSYIKQDMEEDLAISDILMGISRTQPRSAEHSQNLNENAGSRISDFRLLTDSFLSEVNRKEALAIGWMLEPEDVALAAGPQGTHVFANVIKRMTPVEIARGFHWDVVGGSTVRKSKAAELDDVMQIMQAFGGPLVQAALSGMPGTEGPINALMEDMCEARNMPKSKWGRYQFPPPPPPPDPMQDPKLIGIQAKAENDKNKAELDAQLKMIEAELKREEHEADMAVKAAEIQATQVEMQLDAKAKQQEILADQVKTQAEIEAMQAKAQTQAALDVGKAELDAGLEVQRAETSRQVETTSAASKLATSEVQAAQQAAQADASHQQQMTQQAQQSKAKTQQMKAQAKAKPAAKKPKKKS